MGNVSTAFLLQPPTGLSYFPLFPNTLTLPVLSRPWTDETKGFSTNMFWLTIYLHLRYYHIHDVVVSEVSFYPRLSVFLCRGLMWPFDEMESVNVILICNINTSSFYVNYRFHIMVLENAYAHKYDSVSKQYTMVYSLLFYIISLKCQITIVK